MAGWTVLAESALHNHKASMLDKSNKTIPDYLSRVYDQTKIFGTHHNP